MINRVKGGTIMDKNQQIYHDLLIDLKNGKYQPGDMAPSDTKLVQKYRVSRETVRKAMLRLTEAGYVQRIKGKGTVVLERRQVNFPISSLASYCELASEANITTENDVLSLKSNTLVPGYFVGDEQIKAHLVLRRRLIDDKAVILDYDYINSGLIAKVPYAAAKISLFDYYENHLDLTIDYAIKKITIENATQEDRRLLHLDTIIPMVVVRSEIHLADNQILAYTESRHRADLFSSIEFARRRK